MSARAAARPATASTVRSTPAPADTWDAFVDRVPGGGLRQTSRWAELKAFQGWEAHRVVLRRSSRIVAGAQILVKPAPVAQLGAIAYCARGPLVAEGRLDLVDRIVDELRAFCRRNRVAALIVQPARGGQAFSGRLRRIGCVPSPVPVAPEATVVVDVSRQLTEIERDLGKALRNQLRRATRKGVHVRHGDRSDLGTFYALLSTASQRIGYAILPRGYYERLWDTFAPVDEVALFLAELGGRAISAQLCLVSGDTIFASALGWSGEHGNLGANDLLDWHTILYAKERGLRHFDLENISVDAALRLSEGARPSELQLKGSDRYKLKWSRDVVLFPRPYVYARNPAVRAVLRRVPERRLESWGRYLATRLRPMAAA